MIRCVLKPVRTDVGSEMKYLSKISKELLATKVVIGFAAMPGCSKQDAGKVRYHNLTSDYGIKLLSPDSVDPKRPLLNGFKVSTLKNELRLLQKWVDACLNEHMDTCCRWEFQEPGGKSTQHIRTINTFTRELVQADPSHTRYATVSWVWGQAKEGYARLADQLVVVKNDHGGMVSTSLPVEGVPRLVEDAIFVCKELSIPNLWVDVYCINQHDKIKQAEEISAMGVIYRLSTITLVASAYEPEDDVEPGLFYRPLAQDLSKTQRVETIGHHQYISALGQNIGSSPWAGRSWTYQEGQFAKRIAFFGPEQISFICSLGEWRESTNSGRYGHQARIPTIDLRSGGLNVLSASAWLSSGTWDFHEYNEIISEYSRRELTYEDDKLKAIDTCLNLIGNVKGVEFYQGMPSMDFHYALLFTNGYDRLRDGFPSWSWAGCHAMNLMHRIFPTKGNPTKMVVDVHGDLFYQGGKAFEQDMSGMFITGGVDSAHIQNSCSQRLASLAISKQTLVLTIRSEIAKFKVDILPDSAYEPRVENSRREWSEGSIPPDFDTAGDYELLCQPDAEYLLSFRRIQLSDSSGNTYRDRVAGLQLWFPFTVRGSTLNWLISSGIELVNIVEIHIVQGSLAYSKRLNHVLCLGLDRLPNTPKLVRRMGVFFLPKEMWDKAGPKKATINIC